MRSLGFRVYPPPRSPPDPPHPRCAPPTPPHPPATTLETKHGRPATLEMKRGRPATLETKRGRPSPDRSDVQETERPPRGAHPPEEGSASARQEGPQHSAAPGGESQRRGGRNQGMAADKASTAHTHDSNDWARWSGLQQRGKGYVRGNLDQTVDQRERFRLPLIVVPLSRQLPNFIHGHVACQALPVRPPTARGTRV